MMEAQYSGDIKAEFIRRRQEELQRNIVNVRNMSSSVVGSTSWTFRTTGCDVVSVVTTTMPLRNGQMKDVRLHNKEMRRIKPPPPKVPGKINPGNPLQTADEQDDEKVRQNLRSHRTFSSYSFFVVALSTLTPLPFPPLSTNYYIQDPDAELRQAA